MSLEDALDGVDPDLAGAMVRTALDVRELVGQHRRADNGAHTVVTALLDPAWDEVRLSLALVMAITTLAEGLTVPDGLDEVPRG